MNNQHVPGSSPVELLSGLSGLEDWRGHKKKILVSKQNILKDQLRFSCIIIMFRTVLMFLIYISMIISDVI